MSIIARLLLVAVLWLTGTHALPAPARAAEAEAVTVFAAASLTEALEDLARLYRERDGGDVRFSFASASTLARQIEAGAPADIFVSASEEWMDYLAARDLIVSDSRVSPLSNALVLVAPADRVVAPLKIGPGLDIAAMLGTGGRLATGDPDHVPVGRYARDALRALGQWSAVEARLARAENVRAALALVQRGEAALGIVYATDVRATDGVTLVGTFPPDSHAPIVYPFALVAGRDTPAARRFFAFVTGSAAAPIYENRGFVWRGPTG